MLADRTNWTREGGPFDVLAIAIALIVIIGGLFIFDRTSMTYRSTGIPIASAPIVPVVALPQQGNPAQ
jgi:hypothetical protein